MDCSLPGSSVQGIFPGKSTGVGSLSLLPGNFPTWGLNLGLPHSRQTLYPQSHQGCQKKDVFPQNAFIPWFRSIHRKTQLPCCRPLPRSLMRLCQSSGPISGSFFFFFFYYLLGLQLCGFWFGIIFKKPCLKAIHLIRVLYPDFLFYHFLVRLGLQVKSCSFFV